MASSGTRFEVLEDLWDYWRDWYWHHQDRKLIRRTLKQLDHDIQRFCDRDLSYDTYVWLVQHCFAPVHQAAAKQLKFSESVQILDQRVLDTLTELNERKHDGWQ